MTLPFEDIQGFVACGYGSPCARFLLIEVPDGPAGRRFLTELIPEVADARPWKGGHRPRR